MGSHASGRSSRPRSGSLSPVTAYSLEGAGTSLGSTTTSVGGPATTTESPEPVAVRRLTQAETESAAQRHAEALPHGLFPSLGHAFLTRYYASFVDSPYAVALVASFEGRPVGVLTGTVANEAHYRWVLRHRAASLAASAVAALAVRPRTAIYFVRTRMGHYARAVGRLVLGNLPRLVTDRLPRTVTNRLLGKGASTDEQQASSDRDRPDADARSGPPGVLNHVLVADEARGRGVGSILLDTFVAVASREGTGELTLVTGSGEDGAGGFYARRGWTHRADRHDWDGHEVAVYGLALP